MKDETGFICIVCHEEINTGDLMQNVEKLEEHLAAEHGIDA